MASRSSRWFGGAVTAFTLGFALTVSAQTRAATPRAGKRPSGSMAAAPASPALAATASAMADARRAGRGRRARDDDGPRR